MDGPVEHLQLNIETDTGLIYAVTDTSVSYSYLQVVGVWLVP